MTRGWILYDGECGVCRTFVPRWERALNARGYETVSLHEEWVAERLGRPTEELLDDLLLLLDDGRVLAGPEAYRHVMREIGWLRPLYWLSRLPLLSKLFDLAYRKFADHRHQISRAWGLDHGPPRH